MKPASQHALGIDIGGTSTKLAAVACDGEVLSFESIPTQTGAGVEAWIDRIANLLPMREGARSVGISVAGFVNDERTRMIYNPNLPWLQDFPLKAALEARLQIPATLDADSNCACFGEYQVGVGSGSRRFLCLVLGTGVGGGMMIDGRMVRLAHGGLGDLGHVIVDPDGPTCSAGCRGCLEALVNAPAEQFGGYLGIALATHAAILFPDRIAIGGGRAEAGDALLGPAEKSFRRTAGRFYQDNVTIRKARLGVHAPVIGAALQSLAATDG